MATGASNDDAQLLAKVHANRRRHLDMSLEEKRKLYSCGVGYVTLNQIATWPEFAAQNPDDGKSNSERNVRRLSVY